MYRVTDEQHVLSSQLQIGATASMCSSGSISGMAQEETAIADEVTLIEAGLVEASSELEYAVSNSIMGFAAATVDYVDEIVSTEFPNTQSVAYLVGKRAFDIAFAALAVALAAPLMLLIAIAIKLSSCGPVLFRQERVGRAGLLFEMLKFRTMQVADKAVTDTAWRALDDPRRTLVGAFLRRTSLDELPQFFNVLKGEMSVVGPRPERPFFVEKFSTEIPHYKLRHNGDVGITGLAQIRGYRGDTCIQSRVACDLEYLERWSLRSDMWIIWHTVRSIFRSNHE